MYAIVKTGGHQFRVEEGEILKVPKIESEVGTTVKLEDVMMIGGGEVKIGTPTIKNAYVEAEVLEQGRDKKIIVFKFKRRKNYKVKRGHRQHFTRLKIKSINA